MSQVVFIGVFHFNRVDTGSVAENKQQRSLNYYISASRSLHNNTGIKTHMDRRSKLDQRGNNVHRDLSAKIKYSVIFLAPKIGENGVNNQRVSEC